AGPAAWGVRAAKTSAVHGLGAAAPATITAAMVTPSINVLNKVYDRTTSASLNLCAPTGVIPGDSVTCSGVASFVTAQAGVGKSVTVTGLLLSGPAAGNYVLSATTAASTATITPATVTATVAGASKPYDGTTGATITSCMPTGAIAGDVVACSSVSASFDTPAVGPVKTVTAVGLTLGGTDAANYALSSLTATTTAAIT